MQSFLPVTFQADEIHEEKEREKGFTVTLMWMMKKDTKMVQAR